MQSKGKGIIVWIMDPWLTHAPSQVLPPSPYPQLRLMHVGVERPEARGPRGGANSVSGSRSLVLSSSLALVHSPQAPLALSLTYFAHSHPMENEHPDSQP